MCINRMHFGNVYNVINGLLSFINEKVCDELRFKKL